MCIKAVKALDSHSPIQIAYINKNRSEANSHEYVHHTHTHACMLFIVTGVCVYHVKVLQ